jgi:hypothetical protein
MAVEAVRERRERKEVLKCIPIPKRINLTRMKGEKGLPYLFNVNWLRTFLRLTEYIISCNPIATYEIK